MPMRGGILEYYKNLGEGREVDFIVTQNLLAKAISNYRFLGATPDKRNGKYFFTRLDSRHVYIFACTSGQNRSVLFATCILEMKNFLLTKFDQRKQAFLFHFRI